MRGRQRERDRQTDTQTDRPTVGNKDIRNKESNRDTEKEKVLKWQTRRGEERKGTRVNQLASA